MHWEQFSNQGAGRQYQEGALPVVGLQVDSFSRRVGKILCVCQKDLRTIDDF